MKRTLLLLIFGIGLGLMGWGQSYLGLDGGLEGSATIDNSTTTSSPQSGKWTRTDANLSIANETSLVRSGSNSLKISMTSTSLKRVWTPLFTISSTTSKFYVQYYRRSASTTNTQTQQPGVVRGGTEQAPGSYTMVSAANTWEKVTYAPTSTTAATSVAGVILTKANSSGGDVFIDDFCIYAASAVDNTAPDYPTAGFPTVAVTSSTSLTISWTAPGTGVDNGGYLVVRGTSDPTTAPNTNGIYAVNNTIATGMTVVYRGTGTSFLDEGLTTGVEYFYRIYTYDKAYNYSTALTGSGTPASSGTPLINVGTITEFGNQCIGNTYGPYSFTITGTNLTADNITVAALSGFSYSTTSDGSYSSSLDLTQPGGSYSQQIFVKFSPSSVQSYSGDIAVGGGGASSINRSVVGSGVNTAPTVTTTTPATNIAATTVTASGNVTDAGCQSISARGICYGASLNPDISGNKTTETGTTGVFSSNITGLTAATTYHYRAYATSSAGTSYGSDQTFITLTPEPTNHPTSFSSGTITSNSIQLTWTDASEGTPPQNYLIKGSSIGFGSITAPIDGTTEANGALIQNVAQGAQTYTFTSLTPSTTYYFKIWPYTNSGATIDYKLDGSIPQATATTAVMPWVEDFETGTKASYTLGVVTCTKGEWTFDDALIGTTITDRKNGAKSVRLKANSFYMNFDKTTGAGTVTIYHALYGSDPNNTWKLQISINGGTNWSDIGSPVTTSSTTLTAAIFTVNQSGNVRFKIIKTSGTDRTNFDDITITDFAALNPAITNFTGTFSNEWGFTANWDNGNPISTTNVTIPTDKTVIVNSNDNECNNLTIAPNGAITINSGKDLLANGAFLIQSNSSGTGSFIDNGTFLASSYEVQRYVPAATWTDWQDGWHALSSPVSAQAVSGFTEVTPEDYDIYSWYESGNIWVNYKNTIEAPTWSTANTIINGLSNDAANFLVGKGYLVSYKNIVTKSFTGTLNNADVPITGMNISGAESKSFHLLGNPFASALLWDASWTKSNIAATIQVWSEALQDYSAVDYGSYIPAMNGFMVEVTADAASITIPVAKREHNATSWFKNQTANMQRLKLTIMAADGGSGKETIIRFDPMSTNSFDADFDGSYLQGYGPMFYSNAGEQQLSVNTLPSLTNNTEIPLTFVRNYASDFELIAEGIESIQADIFLNDLKTGTSQNLRLNPVYSFSSADSDSPNRFKITFGAVGISENDPASQLKAYVYNNNLYVLNESGKAQLQIFDIHGRLIESVALNSKGLISHPVFVKAGVYVVRLQSENTVKSVKIVVSE